MRSRVLFLLAAWTLALSAVPARAQFQYGGLVQVVYKSDDAEVGADLLDLATADLTEVNLELTPAGTVNLDQFQTTDDWADLRAGFFAYDGTCAWFATTAAEAPGVVETSWGSFLGAVDVVLLYYGQLDAAPAVGLATNFSSYWTKMDSGAVPGQYAGFNHDYPDGEARLTPLREPGGYVDMYLYKFERVGRDVELVPGPAADYSAVLRLRDNGSTLLNPADIDYFEPGRLVQVVYKSDDVEVGTDLLDLVAGDLTGKNVQLAPAGSVNLGQFQTAQDWGDLRLGFFGYDGTLAWFATREDTRPEVVKTSWGSFLGASDGVYQYYRSLGAGPGVVGNPTLPGSFWYDMDSHATMGQYAGLNRDYLDVETPLGALNTAGGSVEMYLYRFKRQNREVILVPGTWTDFAAVLQLRDDGSTWLNPDSLDRGFFGYGSLVQVVYKNDDTEVAADLLDLLRYDLEQQNIQIAPAGTVSLARFQTVADWGELRLGFFAYDGARAYFATTRHLAPAVVKTSWGSFVGATDGVLQYYGSLGDTAAVTGLPTSPGSYWYDMDSHATPGQYAGFNADYVYGETALGALSSPGGHVDMYLYRFERVDREVELVPGEYTDYTAVLRLRDDGSTVLNPQGAGDVTVVCPENPGAGSAVSVPLLASNANGLGALALELSYDALVLEYTGFEAAGCLLEDWADLDCTEAEGVVRCGGSSEAPLVQGSAGCLLELLFNVREGGRGAVSNLALTELGEDLVAMSAGACAFEVPECVGNADCDDGAWCNGEESCSMGSCLPGTAVDCDDGVACTLDSCDETGDACVHSPDHGACEDGLWCNGQEVCNPASGCEAGTAVDCDDGVACTLDSCDETEDGCDSVPDDGQCQAGEVCDAQDGCVAVPETIPPAPADEGGCGACSLAGGRAGSNGQKLADMTVFVVPALACMVWQRRSLRRRKDR